MPKATAQSAPPLAPPVEPAADKKPVHVIQFGCARGSIHRNESKDFVSHTVIFDRCWQDRSRKDHVGPTFETADLRHLAKTAIECLNWIEWQEKLRANGGPPGS